MSSLDISPGSDGGDERPKIRRLNRLPIFLFLGLAVLFFAVIIWGLSQRGQGSGSNVTESSGGRPASDFAEELKRSAPNGMIEEPRPQQVTVVQPAEEAEPEPEFTNPFQRTPATQPQQQTQQQPLESEAAWRERMQREQEEQIMRLQHQQYMARLQANDAAYDSPIAVDIGSATQQVAQSGAPQAAAGQGAFGGNPNMADLYAAAMRAGAGGAAADPNGQAGKTEFFNQDVADLGYLPNQVVPQMSPFELKRGSVIPATLVTGINSDLPGRITAQVSQNVYDSATGHRLLIPQGSKLFGRYDSNVSFGQSRVLVIWTDLIFPNGSTLQLGGMAGVDAEGYGGFHDRVDNHYLQTFGSAILIALIGTGIDMAVPESSTLSTQDTASDAARRNFAESFGRVADQTISRNLDVQPTLEIRPGYPFNIIVEQDIVFPGAYN
ncbi:IncP-type conjugal transfer protein TrbI [Pelagibacterium halotolerans]|uniref:IncP-type conjugal transfer protein TrbI n=1 Tax=Pelagibacterium halotolerans TaxID=531813 RepID=UPI00384FA629